MRTAWFKGKKRLLAAALDLSGLLGLRECLGSGSLVALNYHRLRRAGPVVGDAGVFGPSAEEFRAQMKWLSKNRAVLSEADLLEAAERRKKLPSKPALVTFDDGYRECMTDALPILREFGIPATFFIPTQAIEERRLGWWDQIAYVIRNALCREIRWRGERIFLAGEADRAIVRFQGEMARQPAVATAELADELSRLCDVPLASAAMADEELLSWEGVRSLVEAGMAVGSHTHSHRVLATLDADGQREELLRSKALLESRVGRAVRSIAYPVGGYEHFDQGIPEVARECGYELGFSFRTGCNPAREIVAYDVRRIPPPTDAGLFRCAFAFPELFNRRECLADRPVPRAVA